MYNALFEGVIRTSGADTDDIHSGEAESNFWASGCEIGQIFEQIFREASNSLWLEIKKKLRENIKPLPIVEFNMENYIKYLGGGEKPIITGFNNTHAIMSTKQNGGQDFFEKLENKDDIRGLKNNRSQLIAGIKETLENPILVISDHDEKSRSAISYIRSYNYINDRGQICNKLLKVIVTSENVVISAYFVDYDNIRKLILRDEKILKQ